MYEDRSGVTSTVRLVMSVIVALVMVPLSTSTNALGMMSRAAPVPDSSVIANCATSPVNVSLASVDHCPLIVCALETVEVVRSAIASACLRGDASHVEADSVRLPVTAAKSANWFPVVGVPSAVRMLRICVAPLGVSV